jgi:phenylalanine-4-hydroxylase
MQKNKQGTWFLGNIYFFENYYSQSDTPIHTYTRKIDNMDNLKTCIKVYDVYGHLKGIIHC